MSGVRDFQSYQSVEAAERAAKAESEMELRHAINNHADNLTHLNTHHTQMHADVVKLKDQMDAVLDSLTQINRRLDALEAEKPYGLDAL